MHSVIRDATKLFVWVQFAAENGAFIQVTKKAVLEYLSTGWDGYVYDALRIQINEDGEVFLGKPLGDNDDDSHCN